MILNFKVRTNRIQVSVCFVFLFSLCWCLTGALSVPVPPLIDVCMKDAMSAVDSLSNLHFIREFCESCLKSCCSLALEDMLYAPPELQVHTHGYVHPPSLTHSLSLTHSRICCQTQTPSGTEHSALALVLIPSDVFVLCDVYPAEPLKHSGYVCVVCVVQLAELPGRAAQLV